MNRKDLDDEEVSQAVVEANEGEDDFLSPDNMDNDIENPGTDDIALLLDYQNRDLCPQDDDEEVDGVDDPADDKSSDRTEDAPITASATVDAAVETATLPGSGVAKSRTVRADQLLTPAVPQVECGTPAPMFPGSEPVPHRRRDPRETNDFFVAMGLWCTEYGVSRKQYEYLRQALQLLKSDISKLDSLPETVGTLKKHVRETLPLIEIRKKSVALNPDKLSTQRQARAAEREAFNPNISPTKDLYFFNLADVTKRILQSDLASKMHFGLAELVDNPTQLWHTKAWAASARSTSGQFARYPPTPPPDGPTEPILPSDCVEYFCYDEPCPRCKNSPDDGKPHYGLVSEVYRDKRSDRKLGLPHDEVTGALNDIVLKVFPL